MEVRAPCSADAANRLLARRREVDLDSVHRVIVLDDGWLGVQPAHQCDEILRLLVWMGHRTDAGRWPQTDDQGEARGGEPLKRPPRESCVPVPDIPRDERPQAISRPRNGSIRTWNGVAPSGSELWHGLPGSRA